MLQKDVFESFHSFIIINCPSTVRVVGAPQMIWHLDSDVVFPSLLIVLPPFTVPGKMVLARPNQRETWPYHCSLRLFTMVKVAFMWSDCLLNLGTYFLVGNMVLLG